MSADPIDDGGPAFPAPDLGEQDFGQRGAYPGMTLRAYFAGLAMQAFITARHPDHHGEGGAEVLADDAVQSADALLQRLSL